MSFCIARSPEAVLHDDVHLLRTVANKPNAAGLYAYGPTGLVVETGIASDVTDLDTIDRVAHDLRQDWPATAGYSLELKHVNAHRVKLGLAPIREDDLPFRV